MTSTQQNEAMQAVRLLFVAACGGGSDHKNPETLYRARRVLEEFIESAGVLESADDDEDMTWTSEVVKQPEWAISDTPYSDKDIDGFTLMDEVSVYSSKQRWFVVGLDFNTNEILCNAVDYCKPFVQNRFPSSILTLVSHGKLI